MILIGDHFKLIKNYYYKGDRFHNGEHGVVTEVHYSAGILQSVGIRMATGLVLDVDYAVFHETFERENKDKNSIKCPPTLVEWFKYSGKFLEKK